MATSFEVFGEFVLQLRQSLKKIQLPGRLVVVGTG
jgi:hypothetical protein